MGWIKNNKLIFKKSKILFKKLLKVKNLKQQKN